jgi:hypothetical protein
VQAIFLAAADYHDPEDRGAILDRECSADVELCPQFTALRVAQYQINDSIKQPRVGSDDRDKPIARVPILGTSLSSESHG